jgi:hypothetical protein
MLGTSSVVERWREANPELAGTGKDCVEECIGNMRQALGEKESFVVGTGTALLLFKRA